MAEPENPESREPVPVTPELLQGILRSLPEHQMVQFAGDGVKVYGFIETGETQLQTVRVGETDHSFNVPVREPLLQREVDSVTELLPDASFEETFSYEDFAGIESHHISSPDFLEWKRTRPGEREIVSAAQTIVAERGPIEESEKMQCRNCKGERVFEGSCDCIQGGSTFTDLETGESESLREHGIPDDDCETCHGSGKRKNNCPCCDGSGEMWRYPRLKLVNEVTGETSTLIWDIAGLVADGSIPIRQSGFENLYKDGKEIAEYYPVFGLSAHLKDLLAEIDIDSENTMYRLDKRLMPFGRAVEDEAAYGATSRWDRHGSTLQKTYGQRGAVPTATEMIERVQTDVASHYQMQNLRPGAERNDSPETELVFRPLRPAEETFADLRAVIESYGGALGIGVAPIASGEAGPGFFILDEHGFVEAQLSVEYDVRSALENAWLRLEDVDWSAGEESDSDS